MPVITPDLPSTTTTTTTTRIADDDTPPPRYHAGDRLPAVLELKDLSAILDKSPTRIWRLYEAGDFDFALLKPMVGGKPRFSGKKVQAWIDGEAVDAGPLRRHHFGKGR